MGGEEAYVITTSVHRRIGEFEENPPLIKKKVSTEYSAPRGRVMMKFCSCQSTEVGLAMGKLSPKPEEYSTTCP